MVTKAIIKTIDFNGNTCTVRIPYFETATNKEIICTACISNTPGTYNGYKENDVVWVAFEDSHMDNPVVIGKLYLGADIEKQDPRGTINVENSSASKTASIPFDTVLNNEVPDGAPNTQASYGTLSSLSNQVNKTKTDVSDINDKKIEQIVADIEGNTSIISQQADSINAKVSKDSTTDTDTSSSFGWKLDAGSWTVYNTPAGTAANNQAYYLANVLVELKHIDNATEKLYINNEDTGFLLQPIENGKVKRPSADSNGKVITSTIPAYYFEKRVSYEEDGETKTRIITVSAATLENIKSVIRPAKNMKTIVADYMVKENRSKTDLSEFVNAATSNSGTGTLLLRIIATEDIENSTWYIRSDSGTTIPYTTSYNDTEVKIKYQPLLYINRDVARFTGTLSTNKGNLGAFNIGALHNLKARPDDGNIYSGLYSNGYINKYDASVEDKNGIYLGTDGIKLGDKFSIDIYGNVTAKSLIISSDNTVANSVNLQGGNVNGIGTRVFYSTKIREKTEGNSEITVKNITETKQTFDNGTSISNTTIFSEGNGYRIPLYNEDWELYGTVNKRTIMGGVVLKQLDETLLPDSFYSLSFDLGLENVAQNNVRIKKIIPFIVADSEATELLSYPERWSQPNKTSGFNLLDIIQKSAVMSVLPANYKKENPIQYRTWKATETRWNNTVISQELNVLTEDYYCNMFNITNNETSMFSDSDKLKTALGDYGASGNPYSSCDYYDTINFLTYDNISLGSGTSLISKTGLFFNEMYYNAGTVTALLKTNSLASANLAKLHIGIYVELYATNPGYDLTNWGGFVTIKNVKLEAGKNISAFTYSTSDGNAVKNVGIVEIINQPQNKTEVELNGNDFRVGAKPSFTYVGSNIEPGSLLLAMSTATDTKNVHTLSCRCLSKIDDMSMITVEVLAHTVQAAGSGAVVYYHTNNDPNNYPTPTPTISDGVLDPKDWVTTPLNPEAGKEYVWACTVTYSGDKAVNVSTPFKYASAEGIISILSDNGIKLISKDSSNKYYLKADQINGTLSNKVTVAGFTITNNDSGTNAMYTGTNTTISSTDDNIYIGTDGLRIGKNFRVTGTGASGFGKCMIAGYTKEISKKYRLADYDNETDCISHYSDWTTYSSTNWKTEIPTRADNKYIWEWTRVLRTAYDTFNDQAEDKRVCLTGTKGDQGVPGRSLTESKTYYSLQSPSYSPTIPTDADIVTTPTVGKWSLAPQEFDKDLYTGYNYWTAERRVYSNPTEVIWNNPVMASMLTADFINSFALQAKKVLVTNSSGTLLDAGWSHDDQVSIGGFTVGNNALYSPETFNSMNATGNGVYLGTAGIRLGQNFSISNAGKLEISDVADSIKYSATFDTVEYDPSSELSKKAFALTFNSRTGDSLQEVLALSPVGLKLGAGNEYTIYAPKDGQSYRFGNSVKNTILNGKTVVITSVEDEWGDEYSFSSGTVWWGMEGSSIYQAPRFELGYSESSRSSQLSVKGPTNIVTVGGSVDRERFVVETGELVGGFANDRWIKIRTLSSEKSLAYYRVTAVRNDASFNPSEGGGDGLGGTNIAEGVYRITTDSYGNDTLWFGLDTNGASKIYYYVAYWQEDTIYD